MSHDALLVANKLVEDSKKQNNPLTPLQIIKLVYFCHGWMLGILGKSLIKQQVLAWRYGPVIADVYYSVKQYGGNPVTKQIIMGTPEQKFNEVEIELIEQVLSKYGYLDGIRLSQLTHAPGTPWDIVWRQNGRNSVIPNNLIRDHYAEKYGNI